MAIRCVLACVGCYVRACVRACLPKLSEIFLKVLAIMFSLRTAEEWCKKVMSGDEEAANEGGDTIDAVEIQRLINEKFHYVYSIEAVESRERSDNEEDKTAAEMANQVRLHHDLLRCAAPPPPSSPLHFCRSVHFLWMEL